ncbi:MAG: metallophosphoesterase [Candidatus Neomarinimicrobiota bacterium]
MGSSNTERVRHSRLLFLFTSLALWSYSFLLAQAPSPYFFVVASDPQLFFNQENDLNWGKTISHVNRLRPDFVVVCGDLIHADNDPAKWNDPAELQKYDVLAAAYLNNAATIDPGITLHNVAGNHDVSSEPTRETIAWYSDRFGRTWYSFEHKRSFFIVLESNLMKNPNGAPDLAKEQMSWLHETLKRVEKGHFSHKIAFMHHPLCINRLDEDEGYFNLPKEMRFELLGLFHKYGFDAVFSGHYHRNAYLRDGELELITTSSCGAALGDDPLGLRIVKVYPDRLEHDYHAFEEMPTEVKMKGD